MKLGQRAVAAYGYSAMSLMPMSSGSPNITFMFWMVAGVVMVAVLAALLFLVLLVRRVVRENAVPAIDSLKQSLDNVRGTTEFAGETVASPIIRTYAVVKGVRTGLGAITNLPDRIRGRRKKGRK